MEKIEIDLNHVVQALSRQVQDYSTRLAYQEAINTELQKELDQLKEERVKELDKEAEDSAK